MKGFVQGKSLFYKALGEFEKKKSIKPTVRSVVFSLKKCEQMSISSFVKKYKIHPEHSSCGLKKRV